MRVISGVLTKLKESLVAMAAQVTGLGRKQRLQCCTRKLALVTALEVDGLVWSGRPSGPSVNIDPVETDTGRCAGTATQRQIHTKKIFNENT